MTDREKINKLSKFEFEKFVIKSTNFSSLFRNLDINENGNTRTIIKDKIRNLNISISHFGMLQENDPKYIEKVRHFSKSSHSFYGVINKLGLRVTGSLHQKIKRIIKNNNIDISHFKGRAWNGNNFKKPINKLLIKGSNIGSTHLKKRMLKEGLIENKCRECGISTWKEKDLSLILDHINGVHNDNRIENLRLLCPNCNSLTNTFGGRNIGHKMAG